ncbi:MAG: choice-of-anchor Q domain-containing protein [Terriglobales bacterium]
MNKVRHFALLIIVLLAGATLALAQAPALFFTDLTSGPATGGENGNGVYVTIYGERFGTTQGASTVTLNNSSSALRVVTWGATWQNMQKIIVQVMSGASSGNFVVTVGGTPSNGLPFTVRSGNIYFVATSGSDSNNGSFASPWKTLMKARGAVKAGDTVYAMNGVSQPGDDGSGTNAAFSNFNNGASGTASSPVAFVVYPGATATIGSNSGPSYGLRTYRNYWVIAGFTLSGNVALQINGADHTWAVGNSSQCGNPDALIQGCNTATQSTNVFYYGNYVHDVGNPNNDKEEHTVYFTTDTNHVWAGWNTLANNATCYAMQVHSSPVGSGTGNSQFDLHIFDNVIHGDGCAGINLATIDPSKGTVEVYNNTIYHTGLGNTDGGYGACIFAPGYTNNGTAGSGTVEIYNNTMYDCGPSGSFGQAGIIALSNDTGLTYHLRNNIFYSASSKEAYLLQDNGGTSLFSCSAGDNDFFGNGGVPSGCGSGNVSVDPKLTSVSTADFHPQSGSPMIAAGLAISGLTTDQDGLPRPVTPSVGAFEFPGTSTVARPNPPTNLQVSVQ